MANVFDVAKYILCSIGGQISTMKLQKLCYYSQAWNLAWKQKILFNEEIQAWENGPVCVDLFHLHKGKFSISEKDIPSSYLSEDGLSLEEKNVIDRIVDFYGDKTGAWLSELSHMEDPWKKSYKPVSGTKHSHSVIKIEDMRNYYASLTNE